MDEVGKQECFFVPTAFPVVEVTDDRGIAGEVADLDADLTEGQPALPVLVESPPVGVADCAESTKIRLHQVFMVGEQSEQAGQFPAVPNPYAALNSVRNSSKSAGIGNSRLNRNHSMLPRTRSTPFQ